MRDQPRLQCFGTLTLELDGAVHDGTTGAQGRLQMAEQQLVVTAHVCERQERHRLVMLAPLHLNWHTAFLRRSHAIYRHTLPGLEAAAECDSVQAAILPT